MRLTRHRRPRRSRAAVELVSAAASLCGALSQQMPPGITLVLGLLLAAGACVGVAAYWLGSTGRE